MLGEVLHEMRQFNRYAWCTPQIDHWAAVLAIAIKSHAQPPSNPCALCGAPERYQRRHGQRVGAYDAR
jgi:hypothetical protein